MSITTVNDDGSVTTTDEDVFPRDAESKVVESDDEDKPKARTRAKAETK